MRDDPLKNLAIVQAVKDVPQLYGREAGIPKQEIERLWDHVGSKVDLSGAAARERWRIIRGSFLRYLKSTNTDGGPKKEYYLARYMDFLRPYLKTREMGHSGSFCLTEERETRSERRSTLKVRRKRKRPTESEEEEEEEDEEEEDQREHIQQTTIGDLEDDEEELVEEETEGHEVPMDVVRGDLDQIEDNRQPILIKHEIMNTGDNTEKFTYTLRNGQLLNASPVKTSTPRVFHSPVHSVAAEPLQTISISSPAQVQVAQIPPPTAAPAVAESKAKSEEETNPDMLFFRSLLPQMTHWTKKQRNKFKVAVLTIMDEIDE